MKLLNEILGTKYPIIQGGMANIATGEFAAACSNAGALGLIGAGGMNADTLRQNIRRCKELTDKPFGVNIMLMHPQADEFAKIVVEEGVQVVTTGAGNPGKYVPMWKAAGIKVIPVVAAAVLAKHLEKLGIDAEGLKASVEQYNADAAAGAENAQIAAVPKRALDAEGPYYGVRVEAANHMTKGGVVCNENAQVLNADDTVVPGLYAAGEVTWQAGGYSESVCFGKIAGAQAAQAE